MTHHGSCHCGAVAFELEGEVVDVVDCNCSMCSRRGSLLAFFPREAMRLSTPESSLSTYTFNKGHIRHRFCSTCGIAPFGEGDDPRNGKAMVAVNVRCLPDLDLEMLKVVKFDGASL